MRYKALDMLTDHYAPQNGRRDPFWRPAMPAIYKTVHVPAFAWVSMEEIAPTVRLVDLDVNAAYLSAAAGVSLAHGKLERHGHKGGAPGYYLIDSHHWVDERIVSPLGSARLDDRMWVTEPTITHLQEMETAGYWPEITVHDSYTCGEQMRLRKWTDAIKEDRRKALQSLALNSDDAAAGELYELIKLGYSQAIQTMYGPADGEEAKSKIRRPDWAQSIRAAHAANTWRKMWRATLAGHGPISMDAVDRIGFTVAGLNELMDRSHKPFRLDQTGITLGSFKAGEPYTLGDPE